MGKKAKPISILLAEDDSEDRMLILEALEKEIRVANEIHFVEDGEELMDYLCHRGKYASERDAPRPGLILLDLAMPKKDGIEAGREIKANPDLAQIPIVVLTTSKSEEDIVRSYEIGLNSFITKPPTFEGFLEVARALDRYWFQLVELP
jgi:CheY-like chemotaxis protein